VVHIAQTQNLSTLRSSILTQMVPTDGASDGRPSPLTVLRELSLTHVCDVFVVALCNSLLPLSYQDDMR
jgi:hypothetical protein